MSNNREKVSQAFLDFVDVVRQLRTPETGCPWDLEQDHKSLRPYAIEEAYEVIDAIDSEDDQALKEELGDLLLQVVLHAQVASDRGSFDIAEVVQVVTDKMIRRHPHVFGSTKVENSQEVLKNWEEIKRSEKQDAGGSAAEQRSISQVLDAIPRQLPALIRAQRMGEKAARFNFDWSAPLEVLAKVKEELGELEAELAAGLTAAKLKAPEKRAAVEHELGDLLFSLAQMARWLGLSAEDSLRSCNARFIERLTVAEGLSAEPLQELPAERLEELWQEAKKHGNR